MMQASHKDDKKMVALIYFEMNNAFINIYDRLCCVFAFYTDSPVETPLNIVACRFKLSRDIKDFTFTLSF